jgi:hypothetical protein
MSLIKLAVYGGIGYLVYQTFFADAPIGGRQGGQARGTRSSSGRAGTSAGRQGGSSRGGEQISGGGRGAVEETHEPTGFSTQHRVGRGVVS